MRRVFFAIVLGLCVSTTVMGDQVPSMPMEYVREHGIEHRWLNKSVHETRLLDEINDLERWSHHGFGSMELVDLAENALHSSNGLLMRSPTKGEEPGSVMGRPFGACTVRRNFDGEDWRDYNRLSFWVYPNLPGFRIVSMSVALINEGEVEVPNMWGRNGRHFFLLEPDEWNQVVWEIAHLHRDHITGVEIQYRLQGHEPGATDEVEFYIDRLELQRVDADHFEGWNVAPGEIAFSHTGYPIGGRKYALANGLIADDYHVIDDHTGEAVLTKPIQSIITDTGEFQLMEFSELRTEGIYRLRVGEVETRLFHIDANVWRDTVWKTINLYYCERCGYAIPGIHDICHRDWQVVHGDQRININGGWHDAGDLSQGLVNTAESAYAMLHLAEHWLERDPVLAERLIEEAIWGVRWMLNTRFGDGYRCTWATMDFWTDGILGTVDDVTANASNNPFENFIAVSTQALAARLLVERDHIFSQRCLIAAQEDYGFAVVAAAERRVSLQTTAAWLNAALDLYETTGEAKYASDAIEQARVVLECQQQEAPDWDIPLKGFFYRDPRRESILHYNHRSHEQAPVVGLARLCQMFPEHEEWMAWYAGAALYGEYMRAASRYIEPWGMLPASIYRVDESDREGYREQVMEGVRLDDEHYLRRFPVWFDFRGNHGTILTQAMGVAAAGHLRRDVDLIELARGPLHWSLGLNPFVQSTMWGEGYDFAPQYTAMSGNMVGSLPVGIQTQFNSDVPYWPVDNCYNYKEVWVHPSARWLGLMQQLAGPAFINGFGNTGAEEDIHFICRKTKETTIAIVDEDGGFSLELPEGEYMLRQGDIDWTVSILPGETLSLDLNAMPRITAQASETDGEVTIQLESNDAVRISLRTWNLGGDEETIYTVEANQTVEWSGSIENPRAPWFIVVVPENEIARRIELSGN